MANGLALDVTKEGASIEVLQRVNGSFPDEGGGAATLLKHWYRAGAGATYPGDQFPLWTVEWASRVILRLFKPRPDLRTYFDALWIDAGAGTGPRILSQIGGRDNPLHLAVLAGGADTVVQIDAAETRIGPPDAGPFEACHSTPYTNRTGGPAARGDVVRSSGTSETSANDFGWTTLSGAGNDLRPRVVEYPFAGASGGNGFYLALPGAKCQVRCVAGEYRKDDQLVASTVAPSAMVNNAQTDLRRIVAICEERRTLGTAGLVWCSAGPL